VSLSLKMIGAAAAIALCAGPHVAAAQGNIYGADCHGQGAAAPAAGGVVLEGAAGSAIASDMDCDDRRSAFAIFQRGFAGPLGQRYEWRNATEGDYGYFTSLREYYDGPFLCRDFHIETWRHGVWRKRDGAACREDDNSWHLR
jgi:surface antigen